MEVPVSSPALDPFACDVSSAALWQTWFESGLQAIESNDFNGSVYWLTEAGKHVTEAASSGAKKSITEANLAFAYRLRALDYRRRAKLDCTEPLERERLLSLAERDLQTAIACAEQCFCGMPDNSSDTRLSLAKARASHVVGEHVRATGERRIALEHYSAALTYYVSSRSELAPLDEIRLALFELHYQENQFDRAMEQLTRMESSASAAGNIKWLGRLLAARADTLLQLGSNRDAHVLYTRWKSLTGDLDRQPASSFREAFAQIVFSRVLMIHGYYRDAERLLTLGECWVVNEISCLESVCEEVSEAIHSLRFDAAIQRLELALKQGNIGCLQQFHQTAESLNPVWTDRQIRLHLLSGQLYFQLGNFRESCRRFQEARQLTESAFPGRLAFSVPAMLGQSRVEAETSNWTASIALAENAVHACEKAGTVQTPEMIAALLGLASAFIRDDRSEASYPLCDRARTLLIMQLRSGHPDEAAIQLMMAEYYIRRRDADSAIKACQKALSLLPTGCGDDGFAYARILRIEGESHHVGLSVRCASRCFEQALIIWQKQEEQLECRHCESSLILLGLALTHVSLDSFSDAESTFAMLRTSLCEYKGNAARAGFELNRRGNLMLSCEMYVEASWLYFHAEEYYLECYGPDHQSTRQVQQNRHEAMKRAVAAGHSIPLILN